MGTEKEINKTDTNVESIKAPSPPEEKPSPENRYGEVTLEKFNSFLYIAGIIVTILIFVATVGVLHFRTQITQVSDSIVVEEKTTLIPSPPPLVIQLEKSEITLEILNGSGISGLAGSNQDTFEELGYTVDSIGNAASTEITTILVSETNREKIDALISDVKAEISENVEIVIDEDLDTIAQIILGSE